MNKSIRILLSHHFNDLHRVLRGIREDLGQHEDDELLDVFGAVEHTNHLFMQRMRLRFNIPFGEER